MQDDRLIWYNNYTISNASREDAGNYICTSKNALYEPSESFWKEYLGNLFIVHGVCLKMLFMLNVDVCVLCFRGYGLR